MDPLDALEPLAPQDPQPQQDPKPSPASQSENPYVRLLQEQDEQAEQLAIEAFHAAVKADPAKAREADRIARKLGMPDATLAERKPDEVRRMLAQREWDYHRSAVYSPTLRQQMSDPRFARMAHDDTANLSAYHRIGFAMERGRLIDERGRIGGRMLVGGNSEADIRRLAQINQRMGEIPDVSGWDPVGLVAGAAGIAAQMSSSAVESLAVGATAAAPLVMTGPAGPVTVPVAFTAGAVGMMGARAAEMEAGNFYADMIASGYGDTWQARAGAAAVGIINGALEMGGMSAVSKPVRDVLNRSVRQQISEGLVRPTMSAAAKRLAKNYILGVGAETGTEVLQEVTNIVAEGAVTGKWEEDVAGRLGKIASETAQGMLLLGAPGPIFRAAHDVSEARAALQQQQRFRQRMQAAAESKLRKDNPEAFQDAVAQASDQTLYLNAKDMAEALTQRDEADNAANTDPYGSKKRLIEQIDGLFPGLRERIGEAMVRGGDVTMQASEFAAKLSGTPVGQALEKIVRFDPNGMSAAEAAKIDPEKLADEAIKEAEQQQASDAQWKDEAKAVEAGVYEQLMATGKMNAREAKANAATWRKFVEVQAAEEGLTPKQFADEYALSVKAGEVGPEAMAQGGSRIDTPEFKAWFGESKVVDEKGAPLRVFHGTTSVFQEFSKKARGSATGADSARMGFFFAEEASVASGYAQALEGRSVREARLAVEAAEKEARRTGDWSKHDAAVERHEEAALSEQRSGVTSGASVMPLFLRIQNPLVVDMAGKTWQEDAFVSAISRASEPRRKHDGVIFRNVADDDKRKLTTVYVTFEPTQIKSASGNRGTFDPNDPNILRQDTGPVRGGFIWRDGKPLIVLTKDMNASTFTHELAHAFLSIVGDLAARKTRPKVVDDFNTLLKWFGVKDVATWQAMTVDQQRAHHERFAREFEAWMWEGKEPASGLKALFVRLMKFMRSVYNSWQEITGGERAPDEVREVMARMLASERDVAVAQAIRGAVPQFQTQEESGLDDEAWAKHVERQRAADEAAINELARNDLRNMRWLSGEKAKRLRQMDREAERVRTGERNKVAAEVEQRPVYRAQRWLKTGEFINPDGTKTTDGGAHKLSREAVRELLGLRELDEAAEPKPAKEAAVKLGPSLVTRIKQLGGISTESWNKTFPGERKKEWRIPFMVRASGMSWEAMASQLRSEGYGPEKAGLDGEGSGDNSWLVDALSEHVQGVPQYSRFTMDQLAQMREPDTRAPETDAERADRLEAERLDAEQERARAAAIQVAKPELAVNKLRGMLAKDGYAPDDVATVFGFKTGEQMVREIIEAPALEAAIEQTTDAVMMEKHTDLIDPDKRERSIERALHSEARRRFIASELAALSSSAEEPVRVTMAAAKNAAEVAIAKKKVGEIRASSFAMAARRASKDSVAAMKAGETQQAIDAKRRQLRLEAIADLAVDAEVEIEKGRSFMGKFFGKDADLAKRLDIDFVRAGRALAAAYGFGPKVDGAQQQELTAKALERITEEWPAVAERVVPLLTEASRNGISHNVITVEWFREVVATGEMLWKVAGDAAELVAEEKRKKVSEAVGALSQQIASLPPPPTTKEAPAGQTPSPWRRTMLGFWSALAGLKVAEHWAHWMDGGKQGPFFRYIIAPVMRAAERMRTAESSILREVHREYMAAVERNGAAWTARIYSEELDFTFRGKAELLHAILHTGSESGLRKFLLGERGANGVPLADLTYDEEGGEVVDTSRWERFIASKWRDGTLTKDDAAFLRFMWGQFAKLLPEAQATHRKLYGHEFKTIEHRQILTPFGVLDGGYVPARVDTAKAKFSKRYNSMSDMEKAAESFRYSVGPAKGFTKERSELYRQPLSLDMTKLLAHMSEEVRFVYLGPAVQDVLRILNGKMQVVDEAGVAREVRFSDVLGAYDREAKDGILMPWLQNTALQQTTRPGLSKFGDAAAKTLRGVASLMALGFNLSNSLLQLTGISTAATQVKSRFMRSGLLHFVKNPPAAVREMMAASPAMAQRYDQQSRLLMQQIERTAMNPVLAARDVAKKALARWAFLPQRLFQMAVDTVVWHGARAQAAAMDMGDADAVEAADAAVRRSQGNPNPEGKARYAVATPFVQLFTQFGDYSNNMLNVIMSSQGKSRAVLWALVIPAVLEGALRMMLRPPEDDDGDGMADEVAWGMGKSLARSATGMVPLVGPFMFTLADSEGQRVMESPASGVLKELYQSTLRIMDGEDSGEAEVRAWANLLTALGFPVSAPVRLAQTISADR